MSETHLTPEQIVALRDGELRDAAAIRHLQTCPACRARAREARVLRVLLSSPERRASPHPDPEELAAYAEEALPSQGIRPLVAHLAACPQCFADLEAIRAHLQPAGAIEEAAPAAVVAEAARSFQPPRPPIDLGRVVVAWLRRLGFSLEYLPPTPAVHSRQIGESIAIYDTLPAPASEAPSPAAGRPAASYLERAGEDVAFSRIDAVGNLGEKAPEGEASPVELPAGDLLVRLTARGRTHDDLRLTLFITRQSDGAPVADVHLTLETEEETLGPIATDAAGIAEFPVPPGQATLVFQSPIRAELKISF